jgi:tripartite-type tricarboxylate transporter receptor subunit TctC
MRLLARFVCLLSSTAFLLVVVGSAFAQGYPTKPITLIVPFPAGGTTDVLARTIGQKLSQSVGQPVIVDNRGGAGATLGATLVAKATPDGHTLLMGSVHHTIASNVYKKLSYDFQKDFAPVTIIAAVPNVLVVNPSVPANSVKELIAYAKANPGKLTYGSAGNGTAHQLIGEQFKLMAGVDILHVPYKGSAPAVTALLGGEISMMFDTVTSSLPHIKGGKLRPLGVTTAKRSSALPDVPTLAEAGPLPGFDIVSWFGVLAPAATPKEIVARLSTEVIKILSIPEVHKRLQDIGAEPVGNTPEQMASHIKKDTETFAKIIKEAKVTLD